MDVTCTLCEFPVDTPVTDPDVEGTFCCRGCLEVARTLEEPETSRPEDADTGADPDEASGETAFFSVEGMHCATCETFLESRAAAADGVTGASASYATGAMKVTYDPESADESDLAERLSGTGYRVHRSGESTEEDADPTGRLLVGGLFGMMTMLWYVLFLYPAYVGLDQSFRFIDLAGPAGQYLLWNMAVLTAVVVGYTGLPLLRGAFVSLRTGRPNMDLLVAMAATTAFAYSVAAILLGRIEVYFDVATVIVLAVTVGDYYRDRVRQSAAGRLTDLASQRVTEARRRSGGGVETVPVDGLEPDDEVVVRTGERVPVDGTVAEGTAAVDESLVTGESVPVRRTPGDEVVGGSTVTEGGLVVRVGPDAESTVDRIATLLWDVRSARSDVQRLVDRVAAVFVPLVLALALAAAVAQLAFGAGVPGALLTGLAVLVVSCPCALGLATPLATTVGIRRALEDGVVITGGSVFETASDVDVVALDKTGTLTTGEIALLERPGDRALARAAAVEQFADHPLAEAVVDAAPTTEATVEEFQRHPGRGVSALVDGDLTVVGRPRLFEELGLTLPEAVCERYDRAERAGRVPALVGWDGRARDVLVGGDRPREGWRRVVSRLAEDREVVVITGDSPVGAERIRSHDAVDEVFAGVPPEAKAAVVDRLRSRGTVAMVGDGTNDAPALGAADLGIALASGTELAVDAADAVVTTDRLAAVPAVFAVTAATRRRIRQNLGWAFCYNGLALPAAVLGLLNPLVAAVAMTVSSLLVVGNSARALAPESGVENDDGAGPSPVDASTPAAATGHAE